MTAILSGVRVLDFGRYIAGPMCGTLLGDLGAEVIRVERVGGGEDRDQYPLAEGADAGAAFVTLNRNKKSLTLDLGSDKGREIVRKLVATADIVVANLPIGTLKNLGLDYGSLKAIKPDIILVHTSAYGNEGPYAERVGFDGVAQAMSGMTYLSGDPGRPMKHNAPWVDWMTALFNAYGALAALLHKRATGEGQLVETNLLRSSLNPSNGVIAEQALLEKDRVPIGNRLQLAAPGDIVKTKDGAVLIQVLGDAMFRRWARMMGEEEKYTSDPRFARDDTRGDNGQILSDRTMEWAADKTTEEALNEMAKHKLPGGPVLSPRQVLADPHVNAVGLYREVSYPGIDKPIPMVEPGARFNGEPLPVKRAPTTGEHTDEVLSGLGYSASEIAALHKDGIA